MSIKKRKIKINFIKQVKIFFLTIALILLLGSIAYIVNIFFLPKYQLLSPLSKQNNTNQNQINSILQKSGIVFNSVENYKDSSYLITLTEGGQVIIAQNKNIDSQISSLQLILSRLTIEGKRFKSLDFRFDKPVVIF